MAHACLTLFGQCLGIKLFSTAFFLPDAYYDVMLCGTHSCVCSELVNLLDLIHYSMQGLVVNEIGFLTYWSYNIWISLTFYVPETDPIKYFTFSMIISILGIRGILLNRRNIPIMSMPMESMLLAVNSNFLVFSVSSDDMMGQSFASLVPTVAAAESAIGLAIFVLTFRVRGTIAVEFINSIQG